MGKGEYLGEFEQLILLALVRLGSNAYGMTIRREIEERAERSVAIGAVYATLDRLEEKGYVTSHFGEATPERGGRAKRFFTITTTGVHALHEAREVLARMWKGIKLAEVG
jgi:PadR family transcriptional regulator PadR